MTNIDVALIADRFGELATALRKHEAEAVPGEVCVDDVQFTRLAEFLRRYPDAPVSSVIARVLRGVGEQADEDARAFDDLFRKLALTLEPGQSQRLHLAKAVYNQTNGGNADWDARLLGVIRAWDGLVPLSRGRLALAIKVVEAWLAREGRS